MFLQLHILHLNTCWVTECLAFWLFRLKAWKCYAIMRCTFCCSRFYIYHMSYLLLLCYSVHKSIYHCGFKTLFLFVSLSMLLTHLYSILRIHQCSHTNPLERFFRRINIYFEHQKSSTVPLLRVKHTVKSRLSLLTSCLLRGTHNKLSFCRSYDITISTGLRWKSERQCAPTKQTSVLLVTSPICSLD